MLSKRIIPCLDIKNGRVVKGVNFVDLIDAGDPVETARTYYEMGADELVFLDITATNEKRKTIAELVQKVAAEIFIPLTVGGGIRTIDDMRKILRAGADKVAVNTAAVKNPELVTNGAGIFGSQCIVGAVDAAKKESGTGWEVYIHAGTEATGLDLLDWVKGLASLGAGEILLTSINTDGTKDGFDIEMLKAVASTVQIPVIASGGAGSSQHFFDVFQQTEVSAALAASIFHFGEIPIPDLKAELNKQQIPVRV